MNKVDYDKLLETAGDRLGELMESSVPEIKNMMRDILNKVNEYVEDAESRGRYFDRTHLFSTALIFNKDITEDIKIAAKDYLEADYSYIQYITEGDFGQSEIKKIVEDNKEKNPEEVKQ